MPFLTDRQKEHGRYIKHLHDDCYMVSLFYCQYRISVSTFQVLLIK